MDIQEKGAKILLDDVDYLINLLYFFYLLQRYHNYKGAIIMILREECFFC